MYSRVKFFSDQHVVFCGPCPIDNVYDMLISEDVSVVWNLAEELADIAEKEKRHFEHVIHTKIPDFSIPRSAEDFMADLASVCDFIVSGKIVFVHCLGGRGRTGTALAAIYRYLDGLQAEEALRLAHKACGGPEVEYQKEFVRMLKI